MAKATKRPGRRPTPANEGQRASLGLKVTPDIKNRLDQVARANGRTQSQEAEARLDQSFQEEKRIPEVMRRVYGPQLAGFLMLIGEILREVGPQIGYSLTRKPEGSYNWLNYRFAFDQANEAITLVMKAIRPKDDPNILNDSERDEVEWLEEYRKGIGRGFALSALGLVADRARAVGAVDPAEIGELLGPAADRIRENLPRLREEWP